MVASLSSWPWCSAHQAQCSKTVASGSASSRASRIASCSWLISRGRPGIDLRANDPVSCCRTTVVFARRTRAWSVALAAHLFAGAGFLLGIWATRLDTTPFNHIYHFVMLGVFVLGLVLLLTPGTRAVLRSGKGDSHGG